MEKHLNPKRPQMMKTQSAKDFSSRSGSTQWVESDPEQN